jgi:DNA-binding NarL/FixJ family response regulator
MIRSGDRIPTGTGAARRRLTRDEAEAGGLPEPMTQEEWRAMATASRHDHERLIYQAVQNASAARFNAAQRAKATTPPPPPPAHAIRPTTVHTTTTEVQRMVKLARDGYTLAQIAEAVGRSAKTVSKHLRAHRLTAARSHRRHA